jgi:hypothetical protein
VCRRNAKEASEKSEVKQVVHKDGAGTATSRSGPIPDPIRSDPIRYGLPFITSSVSHPVSHIQVQR